MKYLAPVFIAFCFTSCAKAQPKDQPDTSAFHSIPLETVCRKLGAELNELPGYVDAKHVFPWARTHGLSAGLASMAF